MISQQTIQEIQSRIDIIDVVGSFVKLKRRGSNYIGNCPFHHEKTPSFTVSPSKEIYKCFGCGKSGNTIGFIMDHEKLTYPEALRWLANRYQVEIEETETSPEYAEQQKLADSLYILNQFAAKYFTSQLTETEEGKSIALSYLLERGFDEKLIEKFQLGYSPNQRDAFAKEAKKNQFSDEVLKKSGLVIERDGEWIDNYRGRIIFPIHNATGKIVGFGARVIGSADRGPKYINTPENEVYVKSKILYGIYFAKQSIDRLDECLLVEGYTDVTSMHQAAIENAVASGGTSLTIDQLRLIKKYTNNLTIVYDGDAAGIKAALRGLDLAIEEGLNVNLVLIPDGDDPDSYVKKLGTESFREFVKKNKKDFILFQVEVALKDSLQDSSKKAELVNQIAESISKFSRAEDFTRQQDYIKRCAALMKIDEQGLTVLVNKISRDRMAKEDKKLERENNQSTKEVEANPSEEVGLDLFFKDEMNEQAVAKALLEFGSRSWDEYISVAQFVFKELEQDGLEDLFESQNTLHLIRTYKTMLQQGENPTEKSFLYHSDSMISQLAVSLFTEKHEISPNWSKYYKGEISSRNERYKEEISSCLTYLKLKKVKKLIFENQRDLEKENSEDDLMILLQTHKHLKEVEIELMREIGTVIFK
ncbi:MAG: primase [Bacteroidota bacterium]